MSLEIDYFDNTSTGVMISRLSEDVTILREICIDKGCQVVQNVVQAIGGIILFVTESWVMSLIAVGVVPLIGITFWISEVMIEKLWKEYSNANTNNTSKAEEIIS
jgi:ABC-type multidrug transport system fused ATPase/permease subunit